MKRGDLVQFTNIFGQKYLAISENEVVAIGESYSWPAYKKYCHYYYKVNKQTLKTVKILSSDNIIPDGEVKLDFSRELAFICNEKVI